MWKMIRKMEGKKVQKLTIHEKFNEVLKAIGTNANQISKRLNLDRPDKYYKITSGTAKPSFDTIAEIIQFYPQINANYYFKDNEPIFVKENAPSKPADSSLLHLEIKHLKQKITLLESQNQELLNQLLQQQKKDE